MSEQNPVNKNAVNIKQRFIGAIVLVSLGVIIIPLLLNGGPDINKPFLDETIPEMPSRLTKVLPDVPQAATMPAAKKIISHPETGLSNEKQVAENTTETVKSTKKTAAENNTATRTNTHYKKASKPDNAKINMAYTLQIASFSQKSNAFTLQAKLRKQKFKAYIESITTTKGRVYRLRVGPYLKFEQLEKIQKQIEKQFKLNDTVIVKYETR